MLRLTPVFIILLLFLAGCSMIKNIKLFKAGEVTEESFYKVIGFEEREGYVILMAEIRGEEHDFILDTGAPNLISKSLAEKLGLTIASTGKAVDSKGNVGHLEIVRIDTIKIGGLSFANTSAMVYDLDSIAELYCMDVEGLIGANLMRHAIWNINYKEKKITLTDDLNKLDMHGAGNAVDFSTDVQGTPYLHASSGNEKLKNIMFDMGSSGSISIPYKPFMKIVEAENTRPIKGFGTRSSGIFGSCHDTSYAALINQLHLGEMVVDSIVINTDQNARYHAILGTNVLKHYNFIINWQSKQIIFTSNEPGTRIKPSYGFGYRRQGDNLFILFVYEGSPAGRAGLTAGTQILEINGQDYKNLSVEDYCNLLEYKFESNTLYLTVLENDTTREVVLVKKLLFQN